MHRCQRLDQSTLLSLKNALDTLAHTASSRGARCGLVCMRNPPTTEMRALCSQATSPGTRVQNAR